MIINYPNSTKRIRLPDNACAVGRQLAVGNAKSFAASVMKHGDFQDAVYEETCYVVQKELQNLCSLSHPSLLRKTTSSDLASFDWKNMNAELVERTPRFHQLITSSVNNPSHTRNVNKKESALVPPMCDAACQLISIFNGDMNATRRVKSVILKKDGLKKIGFKRLSALNNCMGYNSTSRMFDSFGEDFDKKLKMWKKEVEADDEREKDLLSTQGAVQVNTNNQELDKHREEMHPGYSFTGDNVDIRCKPRQMTAKNQNKDHHMYQYVAFKNRISPNHLPNDQVTMNVDKVPLTTFLPNAAEQSMLVDEFVFLVGQIWAKHIPALAWFKEHLPDQIQHVYMKETKQKTEKVQYIRQLIIQLMDNTV